MIILYHQNNQVTKIQKNDTLVPCSEKKNISKTLLNLAQNNPKELLVWCHESLSRHLNIKGFDTIFYHKKIVPSYSTSKTPYLTDAIGYVNETPFININKSVNYPTWLMRSDVGGINAEVFLTLEKELVFDLDFDYFLNSMARLAMPLGLFCYSNPELLKEKIDLENKQISSLTLFRFVKQHYKTVWVFLLFLNLILYEKKFPFFVLIISLFYKRRRINSALLNDIDILKVNNYKNIAVDVIIPTIGRKPYLYNVLKDLSEQTILPKNVMIVEQNPDSNSKTELDYLTTETWPFKIKHHFTHQAGACNARNIALNMIESDWVFLADDDIVVESDFIEKANHIVNQSFTEAFTFRCFLKNEKTSFKFIKQWETFGSGCSLVKASAIKDLSFDMSFEFGFGEDADFGMKLRNKGTDIIYLPEPSILHLKAPVGGFRTKPKLPWQNEGVLPKPAPTIMLYLTKNHTNEQVLGYKTILFFKYYKLQSIKNPFKYFKTFKKQWNKSQFWANHLKEQHTS